MFLGASSDINRGCCQLFALASDAEQPHRVHEPTGQLAGAGEPVVGRGRCSKQDVLDTMLVRCLDPVSRLVHLDIGQDRSADASLVQHVRKTLVTHAIHNVVVRHGR